MVMVITGEGHFGGKRLTLTFSQPLTTFRRHPDACGLLVIKYGFFLF